MTPTGGRAGKALTGWGCSFLRSPRRDSPPPAPPDRAPVRDGAWSGPGLEPVTAFGPVGRAAASPPSGSTPIPAPRQPRLGVTERGRGPAVSTPLSSDVPPGRSAPPRPASPARVARCDLARRSAGASLPYGSPRPPFAAPVRGRTRSFPSPSRPGVRRSGGGSKDGGLGAPRPGHSGRARRHARTGASRSRAGGERARDRARDRARSTPTAPAAAFRRCSPSAEPTKPNQRSDEPGKEWPPASRPVLGGAEFRFAVETLEAAARSTAAPTAAAGGGHGGGRTAFLFDGSERCRAGRDTTGAGGPTISPRPRDGSAVGGTAR